MAPTGILIVECFRPPASEEFKNECPEQVAVVRREVGPRVLRETVAPPALGKRTPSGMKRSPSSSLQSLPALVSQAQRVISNSSSEFGELVRTHRFIGWLR